MGTSVWEPIPRVYDPLKAGSIDGTDTIPHDHAVVRAMKAVYKPNKLVVGDPKSTLFVGRLDPLTREETITEIFSRYGKIKRIRLVRDIVTGFSKGYAFVEFKDRHDANDAQRDLNHSVIDNKTILVEPECERTLPGWIPRRLGGGFGGKKESGQLRFGGRERPFKRPLILQNSSERRQEADSRNPHQSKPYFKDRRYDSDKDRHFRKGYDSHRNDDHSRDFSRERHDREKDSRYGRHDYKKSKHH